MIKVLGLALYGPLAASTRYRLGQYVPGLAEHGIDLQIRHLLGDKYLRRAFMGESTPWFSILRAGLERLVGLCKHGEYDAMMLHCELFPLLPGWAERGFLRQPYIYDFDDAFYLKYRTGRLRGLNSLLGQKFDTIMQGAAAITAGSRVLVDYARPHNVNCRLLPTVVDTVRYVPARRNPNQEFVVGWIGSPSTAPYLTELVGPLTMLSKEGPVRLVVIGGRAPQIPGVIIDERQWSEVTEVGLINGFDVGVMPLPDDPWARGKCAFKLIQYMACGVPVIASPVGANVDVVQPECGLLASNQAQWLDALRSLRDRPVSAREMGMAGRELVVRNYSLHRNLPVLADVIRQTVNKG